jgi:hypothetical protein
MNLAKLFGSKCRAKILEKFIIDQAMTGQAQGFFIRELCRDIGEQLNSVRRELMNLEDLKILKSKEDNKKKFYSLNRACPIFDALLSMFVKNYDVIDRINDYFKNKKSVDLIALSENLGNIHEVQSNSIVDIFLIGEIDKTDFNSFLEKTFLGRKIKYATMSLIDFTERLDYNDKLVLSILGQKNFVFHRDRHNIRDVVEKKVKELNFFRAG